MKIKSVSKQALAVLLSLSVLASTLMLNTFSVFAETTTTERSVWQGEVATVGENGELPYDGGDGLTPETAYKNSTGEQLAYLVSTTDYNTTNGKYFELTDDIYLNDVSSEDWYQNAENNDN